MYSATHLHGVFSLPPQLRLTHTIGIRRDARVWGLVTHCESIISRRRNHARREALLPVVILSVRNALCSLEGPVLKGTHMKSLIPAQLKNET